MAAACERVFAFLDAEEMEDESGKTAQLHEIKGNVSFDHVNFAYKWNQPIIKDFSAQVKAGQKIAIVGPTGAGKTTIVNLLMRFYEVSGGSISIDGVPIRDLKRENVHMTRCWGTTPPSPPGRSSCLPSPGPCWRTLPC